MKSKLLPIALAATLISACATTGAQDENQRKANIYADAGMRAIMEGRYSEALGSLQKATKLAPKVASNWNNLGIAYMQKEEPKRAEEMWRKALSVDSEFTDAYTNLGVLYFQQKKFKEAETNFKIALKDLAYQKSAQVHYNLGLTYLSQRKTLNAEQQFKLATQTDGSYCAAWYKLGQMQKDRGEFSEATASIKKSISGSCFNNPEVHYEIGSLYLKTKEYTQAKTKMLEIIQLFPQSDWAKKAELTLNMMR